MIAVKSEGIRKRKTKRINLMDAALKYAEKNIPVFPLHTIKKGICSCKNPICNSVGKHPRTQNGFKDATTDKTQITEWWTKYPHANIGMPTGRKSGFDLLDSDPDKETGELTGEKYLEENGGLPDTVMSETGGGGSHRFYKHTGELKNTTKFIPGLDTKSDGGYAILPPSRHKSGKRYKWKKGQGVLDREASLPPNWLLKKLEEVKGKSVKKKKDNPVVIVKEGERNNVLFEYACKLRKTNNFDESDTKLLIMDRNTTLCETPLEESELDNIVKSVFSYPSSQEIDHNFKEDIKDVENIYLVNKREHIDRLQWIVKDNGKVLLIPEKTQKELEQCFVDKNVVVIGTDNKDIEKINSGFSSTAKSLKNIDLPLLEYSENFSDENIKGDEASLTEGAYRNSLFDRLVVSSDFVKRKLNRVLPEMVLSIKGLNMLELPPRKPLLFPWIYEGDLILISGNAGVGKSWFSMELCSAIQNGRSAFNGLWNNAESEELKKEVVKTLYVDGEMHWKDIIRMGNQLGFNKNGKGILSKTLLDFKDVTPTLNLNEEEIRILLYEIITKSGFKFVVLDNLFSLWAGVDLDSAKEWNPTNQWLLKLRAKGVTVCLLHHTNKSGGQMGSQSKLFNLNTALILEKAKPQRFNDDGEEIAAFYIKVEKMRAKGKGLGNHTFIVNDGQWTVNQRDDVAKEDSNKTKLLVSLLLDRRIKKQKEIAALLKVKPPYLTEVRKKEKYIKLFDGKKPSKAGTCFLEEHRELLDKFYEEHNIN